MRAVLAVGAVLALLLPGAPAAAPASLDALLALRGGDVPTEVAVTSFDPGAPERRVLAWAEFADLWPQLSISGADDATVGSELCGAEPLGWWCGPDAGAGVDASGPCDTFSAWVAHRGSVGAAYTIRIPGESPGPMLCGGFIVPWSWELVEMSALLPPGVRGTVLFEGCYAAAWTVHQGGLCPNSFPRLTGGAPGDGALDTFLLTWRARGPGVALSFDLDGLVLDYFMGAPATITGQVAHGCYDLPPGLHLDGAAFPCP